MRLKFTLTLLCMLLLFVGFSPTRTAAQIPQQIGYQGFLSNGSGVGENGTFMLTFRIYDTPSGGTPIWTEQQTGVEVVRGIFNVELGNLTSFNLPFDRPYWLSMAIGFGVEFSPRTRLLPAPYALKADTAVYVRNALQSLTAADGSIIVDKNGTIFDVKVGQVPVNKLSQTGAVTSNIMLWNGTTWAPGPAPDSLPNFVLTPRLIGRGTADSLLDIARLGAQTGYKMVWNGTSWASAPDTGIRSVSVKPIFSGDGTHASPLNFVVASVIPGSAITWNGLIWVPLPVELLVSTTPRLTGNGSVALPVDIAAGGISTVIVKDSSLSAADFAPGTFPPFYPLGGQALGDLTGTYPNPIVAGWWGRTVDPIAPLDGQVFAWSPNLAPPRWRPTNVATGTGANGQVAWWNTPNTVTGTPTFFWDNVNGRWGFNTGAPTATIDIVNTPASPFSIRSNIGIGTGVLMTSLTTGTGVNLGNAGFTGTGIDIAGNGVAGGIGVSSVWTGNGRPYIGSSNGALATVGLTNTGTGHAINASATTGRVLSATNNSTTSANIVVSNASAAAGATGIRILSPTAASTIGINMAMIAGTGVSMPSLTTGTGFAIGTNPTFVTPGVGFNIAGTTATGITSTMSGSGTNFIGVNNGANTTAALTNNGTGAGGGSAVVALSNGSTTPTALITSNTAAGAPALRGNNNSATNANMVVANTDAAGTAIQTNVTTGGGIGVTSNTTTGTFLRSLALTTGVGADLGNATFTGIGVRATGATAIGATVTMSGNGQPFIGVNSGANRTASFTNNGTGPVLFAENTLSGAANGTAVIARNNTSVLAQATISVSNLSAAAGATGIDIITPVAAGQIGMNIRAASTSGTGAGIRLADLTTGTGIQLGNAGFTGIGITVTGSVAQAFVATLSGNGRALLGSNVGALPTGQLTNTGTGSALTATNSSVTPASIVVNNSNAAAGAVGVNVISPVAGLAYNARTQTGTGYRAIVLTTGTGLLLGNAGFTGTGILVNGSTATGIRANLSGNGGAFIGVNNGAVPTSSLTQNSTTGNGLNVALTSGASPGIGVNVITTGGASFGGTSTGTGLTNATGTLVNANASGTVLHSLTPGASATAGGIVVSGSTGTGVRSNMTGAGTAVSLGNNGADTTLAAINAADGNALVAQSTGTTTTMLVSNAATGAAGGRALVVTNNNNIGLPTVLVSNAAGSTGTASPVGLSIPAGLIRFGVNDGVVNGTQEDSPVVTITLEDDKNVLIVQDDPGADVTLVTPAGVRQHGRILHIVNSFTTNFNLVIPDADHYFSNAGANPISIPANIIATDRGSVELMYIVNGIQEGWVRLRGNP